MDNNNKSQNATTNKFKCPKCNHTGSYIVGTWGTGEMTEELGLIPVHINVDDSDYAECPECGYQTDDHSEFKVS